MNQTTITLGRRMKTAKMLPLRVKKIASEIDTAVTFAKASPFPQPDALARFVYPS